MGEWSVAQIKRRLGDATLLPSDFYYDEAFSEWFPLADLLAKLTAPKPVKVIGRACYCGSGLSFHACHGDGSQY
jgi:hypothetical protein